MASALLDIHAALTRSLQEQTHILTNLATQKQTASVSSINTKDVVTADVLQRSYGMATTTEEAQVFSKIQHDEAQLHKEVAKRITDSLWYEKFDERCETANEAHEKTFEWILQPRQSGDETQWSDFVKWLREGDDLFWVTGKPGSGKTTLMKFIYDNPATLEHLSFWAKDTPLYIAGFFFWWAGTKEQKSEEGLLRALLYSLLQQMPVLVSYVFPSQWAVQYSFLTGIGEVNMYISYSLGLNKTLKSSLA